MTSLDELATRLDKIEHNQHSTSRFFFRYLFGPLILLLIGGVLNWKIERAKESFQRLELGVKRIDAAESFLGELFSGVPERAFIADRLMSKLVDQPLSTEITTVVSRYYSEKMNLELSNATLDKATDIMSAAETIGGPAADEINSEFKTKKYYVVVMSVPLRDPKQAIDHAKDLVAKGYKNAAVYRSTSGYFAVTIGHALFAAARSLRDGAVKGGDARSDSYLISGKTFTSRTWPK